MKGHEAIVVGVSAGGLEALSTILPELPADFSLSVMVVQHRLDQADEFLADHLDRLSRVTVKEVDDKEPIRAGTVYLAPPGYHLQVESDRSLALSVDPPVNYSRPSIDVLFLSAADTYASGLVGVVLTGANSDGTAGLSYIKERGGLAVVQDPATAHAGFMPQHAMEAVDVDQVLGLTEIGPFLRRLRAQPGPVGSPLAGVETNRMRSH